MVNSTKTVEQALTAALEQDRESPLNIPSTANGWQEKLVAAIDAQDQKAINELAEFITRATFRIAADAQNNAWLFDLRRAINTARFPPKKVVEESGLSNGWQAAIFLGFWAVVAIGMNLESKSPSGKARIEQTYDLAAKSYANEVECDDIKSPDLCAKIRKEAEEYAREKLKPYR